MRPNARTPEGAELGQMMARFADQRIGTGQDNRCNTCAFRHGDHLANGSPETLMGALKCALEGQPFMCHEGPRACAGWIALRAKPGEQINVPWDHPQGGNYQAGDVIPLPDCSAPYPAIR